jgi:hypothetical protein
MLDEIDTHHSFDSMYVTECDNCQIWGEKSPHLCANCLLTNSFFYGII